MSGRTELFVQVIVGLSIAGAVMDVLKGKIYNWLTLPALAAGVIASLWMGGWSAAGDSLLGAGAGLLLYGWMFWVGVMGGGDVKLLMALGAWGGLRYVAEVALLGVFLGGAMALVILLFKGRLGDFARRMQRFLFSLFVKELEIEKPRIDRKMTMPYGIPIAAAAIWLVLGGARPWR